jgi:hypothetical protein
MLSEYISLCVLELLELTGKVRSGCDADNLGYANGRWNFLGNERDAHRDCSDQDR